MFFKLALSLRRAGMGLCAHQDEVSAKTVHDAGYLGQPLHWVSPRLGLGAKNVLDFALGELLGC
jgi:hypothetical protein